MSGILLVSGCLSVPIEQSHEALETKVTDAIAGIDSLPRHAPGDREASTRVQDLLADELTAETAVHIALRNNPRIQAHYARLDAAAAERLAARLLRNPEAHGSVIFSEEDSSEEVIELGAEINLLHMILLPKRSRLGTAAYQTVKLDVARAAQQLAYDTRVACYPTSSALAAKMKSLSVSPSILCVQIWSLTFP